MAGYTRATVTGLGQKVLTDFLYLKTSLTFKALRKTKDLGYQRLLLDESINYPKPSTKPLSHQLLARFDNGMLHNFIRGRPARPEDLRKPAVYLAVARLLAEWHARIPCFASPRVLAHDADGSATESKQTKPLTSLWVVLQKSGGLLLYRLVLSYNVSDEHNSRQNLTGLFNSSTNGQNMARAIHRVFSHCDLLSGNIVLLPKAYNSDKETVSFIDCEHTMPAPAAFDIANHFSEWAGFECDVSALPTRSDRREFIKEYLCTFAVLAKDSQIDQNDSLSRLMVDVDLYRGVPGFFWATWAFIKASGSNIDFDYALYADMGLSEYYNWKAEMDNKRAAAGREMPLREAR
ncbi:hypothetical protein H634G_07525 [Metarhizium anisopliae BRIP 53293]|uniref:ethanolamine kinase n=1 Tax=Metarhizium anisopliae BRIP 53293 TaxID=1291518 RepID=A0A0D9NTY6_METAN|nr:hypothetical protein H634G_07525 [Metarhizium anisopliae BRIP 53293]